jgi:hypothetical protein
MAWARIHDGAMNNPKILGLIDWKSPFCVWVWGLSYCQLQLTDGFIPDSALPNRVAAKTAHQLVAAALWTHHADGFRVHDYLDWNDSRETIMRKRKEAKDRMARSRERSREHSREQPANVPRTFSREVLRGVDLNNVPDQDLKTSNERSETVRANKDQRGELEPADSVRWFDRIYAAYPNKERRIAANQAWIVLSPDLAMAQAIFADVERRKAAGWVRLERRFIPHLVRFLEEKQWQDAPEPGPIYEETDDVPHAWTCKTCGEIHEGSAVDAKRGRCLAAVKGA